MPHNGLKTGLQRRAEEATAGRNVRWANPREARATGNQWAIAQLSAEERDLRKTGRALDRDIEEYARQIAAAKAEAGAARDVRKYRVLAGLAGIARAMC